MQFRLPGIVGDADPDTSDERRFSEQGVARAVASDGRYQVTRRAGANADGATVGAPPQDGSTRDTVQQLTAQLEAALLGELRRTYHHLNATYFKSGMKMPAFALSKARSWLGRWLSETRTIELGYRLTTEQPWTVVVEVLKHEMAHQYLDEVLQEHGERAHGPAFRRVCQRMGIDARAAGMPGSTTAAEGSGPTDDARVLARVARLLALAESPNAHEARAAMSAAQRLMLKHNLDTAVALGHDERSYSFRHIGRVTGRVRENERILAGILGEHFFVEVIWIPVYRPRDGKRGSVLEACGTVANLEMAAYVHTFLTHTAEQLWQAHKRGCGIASNRERQTYLAGVMVGFHEKLVESRQEHQRAGLVWVGDPQLEQYYRRRHPHIQRVRHAGNQRTEAHGQGREAGRQIVLHRPMEQGPKMSGGMLPARRS
ncbi:MAG: SprT-like domain-containing protein [Polyangiaceae bacterium]|nr:SprT-like domain-containing protein [Polyangiaceae bacterium]